MREIKIILLLLFLFPGLLGTREEKRRRRNNNNNKEDRVRLRLAHVIPAEKALDAMKRDDDVLKTSLLSTIVTGFSKGLGKGEEIAIQTKEEYGFKIGESTPFEEEGQIKAYLTRVPNLLPKPEDHATILSFAKMSANSYVSRSGSDWRNSTEFQNDEEFGWEGNGLRGHIFANTMQTIIVIAFKGTSTILTGGETVARDKYMDNVMFSCCCARVDISWSPVCGCYSGPNQCSLKCLRETIREDPDSYYNEALAVTELVIAKYPRAQIWFTGHSLGGAIASLMAVTVKRTAAVTFSIPGPFLYAQHLGLYPDQAKGSQWQFPVWNFGLASDPIYMGTCTGLVTSCYLSGYAIETACRHGMDCRYAVSSWQPDVATHRIDWFIDNILTRPEKYPLPQCTPNRNCTDCKKWSFI